MYFYLFNIHSFHIIIYCFIYLIIFSLWSSPDMEVLSLATGILMASLAYLEMRALMDATDRLAEGNCDACSSSWRVACTSDAKFIYTREKKKINCNMKQSFHLDSAHFSSMRYYSKRFTVYYYPGHWIQHQSCTHSAPSQQATNKIRILPGTHSYTWVESGNVDKVSCWRTKSARHWQELNLQPFDPQSRVQSNIPQHLHR